MRLLGKRNYGVILQALMTLLLLALLLVAAIVCPPSVVAQGGGDPGLRGTIVLQAVSGGPIYAIDASGSNFRYLTMGIDPTLSPDGQWVAFTRWEDTQHGAFGGLWVINVDGTGERVVLSDVRQPKSPAWSPDGRQIVVSMQEGGRLQPEYNCSHQMPSDPIEDKEDIDVVYEIGSDGSINIKLCYTLLPHPFWGLRVVDVETGAFRDLPRDRFSYAPAWDPANDWHLIYKGDTGLSNLDINQDTTWQLTSEGNDHTPAFSPDGSRIAVSYWQHDHWEIHVMGAGGDGRVRLTQTPLRVIMEQRIQGKLGQSWNNVAPAWSPDGSQIAFLTDRTGRWEIWTMAADGTNQRPLFPGHVQSQLNLQYNGVDERMISWK